MTDPDAQSWARRNTASRIEPKERTSATTEFTDAFNQGLLNVIERGSARGQFGARIDGMLGCQPKSDSSPASDDA